MGDLSRNFDSSEFFCKCPCHICNVSPEFIEMLQTARILAGIPFRIISGCRCPSWNKHEGGTYSSDHITTDTIQCQGADIACYDSTVRYRIINAALNAGFRRIGIAKSFLHIGMSKENPQEVIWLYD